MSWAACRGEGTHGNARGPQAPLQCDGSAGRQSESPSASDDIDSSQLHTAGRTSLCAGRRKLCRTWSEGSVSRVRAGLTDADAGLVESSALAHVQRKAGAGSCWEYVQRRLHIARTRQKL